MALTVQDHLRNWNLWDPNDTSWVATTLNKTLDNVVNATDDERKIVKAANQHHSDELAALTDRQKRLVRHIKTLLSERVHGKFGPFLQNMNAKKIIWTRPDDKNSVFRIKFIQNNNVWTGTAADVELAIQECFDRSAVKVVLGGE